MRFLGVDPGLRKTGYGLIDASGARVRLVEAGVIEPPADQTLEVRLAQLHQAMGEIVAAARPDAMVVEELWTGYRNPSTAVLMGHARGVLYLAAAQHGVAVHSLSHSLVKRALVGSGSARKEQVKSMVMQLLALRVRPQPDDVSDALALAIAWALRASTPAGTMVMGRARSSTPVMGRAQQHRALPARSLRGRTGGPTQGVGGAEPGAERR